MVYRGASGDLIKAAVDQGARGIVIATAGAGATSGTQAEGIAYAAGKGVFVVSTTRTGSGRIAARQQSSVPRPVGTTSRRFEFQIAGEDLAPVKARILLMLALTKTQDPSEIQRMFTEY
jgi:L-asparaginase